MPANLCSPWSAPHMPTCYGTRALQPGIGRPVRPDVRVRTVRDPARPHQEPRRNQRISEYGQPGEPSNGARADPPDSDHPLNAKPGSEPQQCSSLRVGSTGDGGGDHEQRRRRRSAVSSHQEAGGVGAPHLEQLLQPTRGCDGQEQTDAGGDGSTDRETVSRIHAASTAAPSNDVDSLSGKGRHPPVKVRFPDDFYRAAGQRIRPAVAQVETPTRAEPARACSACRDNASPRLVPGNRPQPASDRDGPAPRR